MANIPLSNALSAAIYGKGTSGGTLASNEAESRLTGLVQSGQTDLAKELWGQMQGLSGMDTVVQSAKASGKIGKPTALTSFFSGQGINMAGPQFSTQQVGNETKVTGIAPPPPPPVPPQAAASSYAGGVQPAQAGNALTAAQQAQKWTASTPTSGVSATAPAASSFAPTSGVPTTGVSKPMIQSQPQDPWAGVDLSKFNPADFNPGGKLYNPGFQAPRTDTSALLAPQGGGGAAIQGTTTGAPGVLGGFSMQPGLTPVSTAVPGSYSPSTPQLDPSIMQGFYDGSSGVTGTQINPENTLRTQQFLPGATQNPYDQQAYNALQGVQGGQVTNPYDQQAAQTLAGTNMSTEFSPIVGETRDMIMERLRGLQGPDRTQLAQEAFDIFQQQNEPRYQQELRGVGGKAAALGRVGAGMTTNELTDVWTQRNRDLDLMQRGLINEAAGQTLQDRLNALQGTLSGSGTLEGQDFSRQQAAANLGLSKAGQYGQLGQNQFGREQANAGLGLDRAQILAGMGSEEFGRQKTNYEQTAQERSYQDQLARTAVEDRIRQQDMEQAAAEREWQRQQSANQLAAQIAMSQDTGYPGIQQPQGDSFTSGLSAGAAPPTYTTGGSAPSFYDVPQIISEPTDIFADQGIGLQNQPYTAPGIFGGQGLGLQNKTAATPLNVNRRLQLGL